MTTRQAIKHAQNFGSACFAWGSALIVFLGFCWLVGETLRNGFNELSWSLISELPSQSGRAGGISSIIVSTGLILLVCLAVSLPLGLLTSIYLAEISTNQSKVGWLVRRSLDVLAGVPSIVFGLFGNALFCNLLGLGNSILAGGLTLACMVLPLFVRIAEEGIRNVPNEYRYATASLGLSRTTTLFRVIVPAALPALAAGFVLAVGRALSETAALIFTSGIVTRMPGSLMDSGRTISVHIYELTMNVLGGDARAYASATLLVLALFLINGVAMALARYVSRRSQTSLKARQLG